MSPLHNAYKDTINTLLVGPRTQSSLSKENTDANTKDSTDLGILDVYSTKPHCLTDIKLKEFCSH